MASDLKTLDTRLLTRRCVACGYDGALLRGGLAERCPRCNCNLRRRPARSYAEMEGLLAPPALPAPAPSPIEAPEREERLIHRWLAFLFFAMLGILAMLYLTASVFGV